MKTYLVEYEKINLMISNPEPQGSYKFNVSAETLEKGVLMAFDELRKIGMKSCDNDVWNAHIKDTAKKYPILHEGAWLIDHQTGKILKKKS